MKKLTLAKHIAFMTFALLFFAFAVVLYVQGFQNKMSSDSKIKFDEEALMYLIISICFIVLTIYNFVTDLKNIKKNPLLFYGTTGTATIIYSTFNLGVFFSALLDYWSKDYFVFKDYQMNLYCGLVSLALFVGIVIKYFDEKKNN